MAWVKDTDQVATHVLGKSHTNAASSVVHGLFGVAVRLKKSEWEDCCVPRIIFPLHGQTPFPWNKQIHFSAGGRRGVGCINKHDARYYLTAL